MKPRWVEWLPWLGGLLTALGLAAVIGLIIWLPLAAGKELDAEDTAEGLHHFIAILKPWMKGMLGAVVLLCAGMILYWAGSADRRTRT